jgi:hypothetical protein
MSFGIECYPIQASFDPQGENPVTFPQGIPSTAVDCDTSIAIFVFTLSSTVTNAAFVSPTWESVGTSPTPISQPPSTATVPGVQLMVVNLNNNLSGPAPTTSYTFNVGVAYGGQTYWSEPTIVNAQVGSGSLS